VQPTHLTVIAALAASLALSACATTSTQDSLASNASVSSAAGVLQRDLTPQEKKAIVDAIAPSLRNPGAAKYKWSKFPTVVTEDSVNYCATVDAQSPYPAYSGHQAYIVEAKVVGGHVTGAVMGLIAGGKDYALVTRMCSKYGLDPSKAS
jgi:outer membrane murein-binding lipoprotein Lpp